jgi:hypothetical protein
MKHVSAKISDPSFFIMKCVSCDNQTYQRNFAAIEIGESSGGNKIMGQ